MANPLRKGLDTIDALLEKPDHETMKAAIDVLATLSKGSDIFQLVTTLRADMIQFNQERLAGYNMQGRLNPIIVRFQEIYKEFLSSVMPAGSRSQDQNYDLLCKLNFDHQTTYFESLMKGNKKFVSFVIRGPKVDYGQRWLANKLINDSRNNQPLHEPLGLDFLQLNLKLESFIEHLAEALGIPDHQTLSSERKRMKLRKALINRISTATQFIILINSYAFLHSEEYQEFLNLIKNLSIEINDEDSSYKCVFLFVEQQTSAQYNHVEDCIFVDEKTIFTARKIQEFRFIDLGLTTAINAENINNWLGKCSDEYLFCFETEQAKVDEMLKFIGDGNPQNVIPNICKKIGIDYLEKEKIWLKY